MKLTKKIVYPSVIILILIIFLGIIISFNQKISKNENNNFYVYKKFRLRFIGNCGPYPHEGIKNIYNIGNTSYVKAKVAVECDYDIDQANYVIENDTILLLYNLKNIDHCACGFDAVDLLYVFKNMDIENYELILKPYHLYYE